MSLLGKPLPGEDVTASEPNTSSFETHLPSVSCCWTTSFERFEVGAMSQAVTERLIHRRSLVRKLISLWTKTESGIDLCAQSLTRGVVARYANLHWSRKAAEPTSSKSQAVYAELIANSRVCSSSSDGPKDTSKATSVSSWTQKTLTTGLA